MNDVRPQEAPATARDGMKRGAGWIGMALGVLVLVACASPTSRFYTLTGEPPVAAAAGPAIAVGPVTIPAVVDRPEIVTTVAPNQVWPDEFNRWAAPLADGIGLALAQDLAASMRSPRVTLAAATSGEPDYRVAIEVQRFDSVAGSHALQDSVWTVRRTRDGTVRNGRTTARETAGEGYEALAAAHSRALAQLAQDIAHAIAAMPSSAAATPPPVR